MRCRICSCHSLVLPEEQSFYLKLIRPFISFAFCTSCATECTLRGPLLFGPRLPRGDKLNPDRTPESSNPIWQFNPTESPKNPWWERVERPNESAGHKPIEATPSSRVEAIATDLKNRLTFAEIVELVENLRQDISSVR